jgi:hypothetical protein
LNGRAGKNKRISGKQLRRIGARLSLAQSSKSKSASGPKRKDQRDYLHLFVSSIGCKIREDLFKKDDHTPSPFVCFVSTPADAIKKDTPKWDTMKRALGSRASSRKSLNNAAGLLAWPRTKQRSSTLEPQWHDEEVHFKVRTHQKDGSPIDLTGAMMHVVVFDGKSSSKLIGTFTLNLASLIVKSRKKNVAPRGTPTATSVKRTFGAALRRVSRMTVGLGRSRNEGQDEQQRVFRHADESDKPAAFGFSTAKRASLIATNVISLFTQNSTHEESVPPMGNHGSDPLDKSEKSDPSDGLVVDNEAAARHAMEAPQHNNPGNSDDATGVATGGPCDALKNAATSVWFGTGARTVNMATLRRVGSSRGARTTLDSMNIQSLKVDEHLMKNGMEVGRIKFTIDSWWTSDAAAAKKSESNQTKEKDEMAEKEAPSA